MSGANPNEPALSSTDQVILTRLTRMPGIPEDIHQKLTVFRQKFIDSTNQIVSQRVLLAKSMENYRERSSACTVHKSKIQTLQVKLDKVLQKIEDIKFQAGDSLKMQDFIQDQQRILDHMNHLFEDTVAQKEKAKIRRKDIKQEIQRVEGVKAQLREALQVQWGKHSHLTKTLREHEAEGQQLSKTNDETQRAISTLEVNAEEWRRKKNVQEQQINAEIRDLEKQLAMIETQIADVTSEKNEAISSYQQQIATLTAEMDSDNEKIKEQVREIGAMKAQIESIVEETQVLKDTSRADLEELSEQKKILCDLMAELAEKMALPETQTKEIATLEMENRELKARRDDLKELWRQATENVENLADQISRVRIAKYDPAAQESAIKERILRDSAIRVQDVIASAVKLVSCGMCGQILETPVTLVPCGHSVCYHHRFQQMEGPVCPVCGERSARAFVDNSLAIVVSKFIYFHDVLQLLGK
jgi:chromosome segregation ATPase